jgi:hypothetical protein
MRKAKKTVRKRSKKRAKRGAVSRRAATVVKWQDADSGGHFEMYLPPTWKSETGDPE